MLPREAEVEDFLESVGEVARLIDGLKAGTIPPEYVDAKLEDKAAKSRAACAKPAPAGRGAAAAAPAADAAGAAAKQAELARKVEELKARRQRKQRARQLYEAYKAAPPAAAPGGGGGGGGVAFATDYTQWDLWCPSDEEDDLFNSATPNSPAFRAMERDINERHARMVEQRQIAERQRQAGNAAFGAGQFAEALRCYEAGLDAQRHDMRLHANAALAALKLRCHVAALEHCDKVLHLADVLHNKPQHPLCVKALQRRAAAHQGLEQHGQAVADLEAAATICPGDAEVLSQLQRARLLHEEHKAAKKLARAAQAAGSSGYDPQQQQAAAQQQAAGAPGQQHAAELAARLQRVHELAAALAAAGPGPAGDVGTIAAACEELQGLVQDADCCLYFRNQDGVDVLARLLTNTSEPAGLAAVLSLLSSVCDTAATSLEQLAEQTAALAAVLDCATSPDARVAAAALELACTASACTRTRPRLCQQLLAGAAAGAPPPAPDAPRLGALLRCCCTSTAAEQLGSRVLAACTLSNALLVPAVREAALPLLQQPGVLDGLAEALQGTPPALAAKLCALLGNMANHPGARKLLAGTTPVLQQLLAAALPPAGHGVGAAGAAAAAAAMACLCNLAVEPSVQDALGQQPALLASLLQLATSGSGSSHQATAGAAAERCAGRAPRLPARSGLSGSSPGSQALAGGEECCAVLVERAARLLSRAAKQPGAARQLVAMGAVPSLVAAAEAALDKQAQPPQHRQQQQRKQQQQLADAADDTDGWLAAAVRTLALLTGQAGAASGLYQVQAAAAIGLCCRILHNAAGGPPAAAEALAGNAALCLGHFAATGLQQWRDELERADAVAALLRTARSAGRGSGAARNAGIALAHLARGSTAMLERLRELRGLEVLYANVRP